ncbi:ribonuclease H-like [Stegodyphus dumicola]|uniref:ribonuclease H-like n=1 Tax=Stegodyphus dumicola TaxID=202533 RepID=UPI0015B105DE|nr:ribonuclease H-like [Stegodyphus dumicola]
MQHGIKNNVRVNNLLIQIQMLVMLSITKCFRTVSNACLFTLSGCEPIYLIAQRDCILFVLKYGRRSDKVFDLQVDISNIEIYKIVNKVHPALLTDYFWDKKFPTHEGHEIFTDGSKIDERVGCSFVAYLNGFIKKFRLSDNSTVFQAEVFAILKSLEWILGKDTKDVDLFSDSQSALLAIVSGKSFTKLVFDAHLLLIENLKKRNINLHWIKGHIGHEGNELADTCAKQATLKSSIDDFFLPLLKLLKMH